MPECVMESKEAREKSDPLELEKQMLVNCHVGSGTRTQVLCKINQSYLLTHLSSPSWFLPSWSLQGPWRCLPSTPDVYNCVFFLMPSCSLSRCFFLLLSSKRELCISLIFLHFADLNFYWLLLFYWLCPSVCFALFWTLFSCFLRRAIKLTAQILWFWSQWCCSSAWQSAADAFAPSLCCF